MILKKRKKKKRIKKEEQFPYLKAGCSISENKFLYTVKNSSLINVFKQILIESMILVHFCDLDNRCTSLKSTGSYHQHRPHKINSRQHLISIRTTASVENTNNNQGSTSGTTYVESESTIIMKIGSSNYEISLNSADFSKRLYNRPEMISSVFQQRT